MNGIDDELEGLIRESQDALSGYLASLGVTLDLIDDMAQDVFLVVIRDFAKYDRSRPFKSWLFGIARNLVHQEFRRNRVRSRMREGLTTRALAETPCHANDIPDREETRRRIRALRQCMKKLPERMKRLVHFRYMDSMRTREIVARTGSTGDVVRKTIYRARAKLLECVNRELRDAYDGNA